MRLHVHHRVGTKFKSVKNNLTQKLSIVKTIFSNPAVSLCEEDIQAVTQACGTVLADRPYRPGMMTNPPRHICDSSTGPDNKATQTDHQPKSRTETLQPEPSNPTVCQQHNIKPVPLSRAVKAGTERWKCNARTERHQTPLKQISRRPETTDR